MEGEASAHSEKKDSPPLAPSVKARRDIIPIANNNDGTNKVKPDGNTRAKEKPTAECMTTNIGSASMNNTDTAAPSSVANRLGDTQQQSDQQFYLFPKEKQEQIKCTLAATSFADMTAQLDSTQRSGQLSVFVPTHTQPDLPMTDRDTNNPLRQANPVPLEDPPDTTEMMYTHPVDLEPAKQRQGKRRRQRHCCILAAMVMSVVLVIVVGALIGSQVQKEPEVIILPPTESATVYGPTESLEGPSAAPTGLLDLLLDTGSLPMHTLASINSGSETPQWKAWQWLSNHQNITALPNWRKSQLFALATFFYAFEGENWPHSIHERWMDETKEECEWFSSGFGGFVEDDFVEWQDLGWPSTNPCNRQGQFTNLHLEDLQLSGLSPFVPAEITLLTSLLVLKLDRNDIAVPMPALLPSELYTMTSLTLLELHSNRITGQIPFGLGELSSLTELLLSLNQITGPMPSELAKLTGLNMLRVSGNLLTGQIPSEFGQMTSLTSLDLNQNQFSGPIPSSLGQMTALSSLALDSNQLSGYIPSELGQLTALTGLWLYDNQLTGKVPSEFGQATALIWLDLQENQCTGKLASELGHLTGLTGFHLEENRLTGQIPSNLGQLSALRSLSLGGNQLTGEVPSELGQLTALLELWLHENQLRGVIPKELCWMQALHFDCTSILCGCDCYCSN
ncbi:unknown protein [Seminavis robusta]|uniref:L domain-like protein n=1 Tax=Seminavis robusta TaxID=568900 RepID=A0A9N8HXQ0_9STRA|nr:unknown protein [Seminavis robusta]|eukprot:Sro2571_g331581.1  (679) ;mRNA; r:7328-9364